MEQLAKLIAKKVGITEKQAAQAIEMVLNFIKDKLPEPFGSQVEKLLGDDAGGGLDLGDAANLLGGLLGNKK